MTKGTSEAKVTKEVKTIKEVKEVKVFKGVNWNEADDNFTKQFLDMNKANIWFATEIPLSDDKLTWKLLSQEEQLTYQRILAGLTVLDTVQAGYGMPLIAAAIESSQVKHCLSTMGMMEYVHAESYSSIFITMCKSEEITTAHAWAQANKYLQKKVNLIHDFYEDITDRRTLYKAMCASVMLESFLFYSGFYYPLALASQGKMTNSGEIISLILRDEAVHGAYVAQLSKQIKEGFNGTELESITKELRVFFYRVLDLELKYTKELYADLGKQMCIDVTEYVMYNAQRALSSLGYDWLEDKEFSVNPLVLTALNLDAKKHDFFSSKGNSYKKPTFAVENMTDADFW